MTPVIAWNAPREVALFSFAMSVTSAIWLEMIIAKHNPYIGKSIKKAKREDAKANPNRVSEKSKYPYKMIFFFPILSASFPKGMAKVA